MILNYPPEYFSHLADGVLDVWVDPGFSRREERWIFKALDLTDYEINQVDSRRDADFRMFEVKVVDPTKPSVAGRAYLYSDKEHTKIRMKTFGDKKVDRFIINHEIGHSLGLAHRFDTPVGQTVMNYPTFSQLQSGEAAAQLTEDDLNNIRNFSKSIINGDDILTGQHYCTADCVHEITY